MCVDWSGWDVGVVSLFWGGCVGLGFFFRGGRGDVLVWVWVGVGVCIRESLKMKSSTPSYTIRPN